MFRLWFLTFFGQRRFDDAIHPHESPLVMQVSLGVLAVLSVSAGALSLPFGPYREWLTHWLTPAVSDAKIPIHGGAHALGMPLLIGTVLVLTVCGLLSYWWVKRRVVAGLAVEGLSLLPRLAYEKLYVDQIYTFLIVRPVVVGAGLLSTVVDTAVFDGVVRGLVRAIHGAALQLRRTQTGHVGTYVLMMVMALVILLAMLTVVG
jgi:NADH-quinone oxidoreductase subunit L